MKKMNALPKKEFSIDIGGKTLTLEISQLASRTNAAVLGKYGETVVLVSVVMGNANRDVDYMPLRVDYEERFYASGKIIGSRFIRREGRPSEDAVLTGRLVDRVLRPLFDQRIRREIQVVVTVLAFDEENDPDFVGLIAASTALGISDVPWNGPVAGVRVAKINDSFVINPGNSDIKTPECSFETFVAGVGDKINMIELGGKEAADEEILRAFDIARGEIKKIIDFQQSIIKEAGKPKADVALAEADPELKKTIDAFLKNRLQEALFETHDTTSYGERLAKLEREFVESAGGGEGDAPDPRMVHFFVEEAVDALVHKNALEKGLRPDGRGLDELRSLDGAAGLFERTHGSAVFIRGNTQALAVTTLAPPGQEQLIETMEVSGKRRFILHYNFPPYSVGETGPFRGPGRREIGHGALAEKAIHPMIPDVQAFPYTIRVVSEILSSNGSSSMATVCAGSMSLMDAGVPIKKHIAGIAMGMMSDKNGNYKILTDIQGPEDHHGDMDFKVAGTRDGINAIQLDVKCEGLAMEMIEKTLAQAKKARIEILQAMDRVIAQPREHVSKYAPKIIRIDINPEKIGRLIGSGGKTINNLIKKTEVATIDIEEDGRVYIAAEDIEKAKVALKEIEALTKEYEVGDVVEGAVIKTLDFGAIVDLGGGQDGMVHISELKNNFVKNINDVVKVGDRIKAKVIKVDADGHIGLSVKQLENQHKGKSDAGH